MEKFEISVVVDHENQHFEVRDYMHHEDDKCKYEVFKDGQFIGSFEPDHHKILHVCQNPGVVSENVLNLIAEQLEGYHI
ncbi:hypothetical protein [Mucilaginibacter sp. dw_454]|uniref:hypothetical protein n=1 Tax=Mucilaginibacter sp. dw_454 TaxID=2720079 RepID=UPI001BD48117|nr:hypothetical protein [Mucilaginibacter sp. dw_454]